MPVHNTLPYLDEAVESILNQTFANFEFVILDDASTDGSTERLREWASKDRRIRLIESPENLGPAVSSQYVASAALSPIVARMDSDDVADPSRLEKQLDVLDRYPDVGVVASLYELTDSSGRKLVGPEPWRLNSNSAWMPFAHGTMMYRRTVFDQVGGYRAECEYWEDQDLVNRLRGATKIMVFAQSLYVKRVAPTGTRVVSRPSRVERALDLMYRSHERLQRGLDYRDLLDSPSQPTAKLDPRVFVGRGKLILWAGEKPQLLRRLIRHGVLSFDLRSLRAIAWCAWASVNPRSLRSVFRLLFIARTLHGPTRHRSDVLVEWPPRG